MNDTTRQLRRFQTPGAISITCPWCGSAIRTALRDIRTAGTLACPACSTVVGLGREAVARPRDAIDRAAA